MAENQTDANLPFFRALSAKYGMSLQFIIKEFHVMDLLKNIITKADETVIFKGGTALNRVYASGISRFSEDLDFDYIAEKSTQLKIKFLDNIMKIEGYTTEKSRLFRNRLRFDCSFRNEMGKKDVVRADFNLVSGIGKAEKRPVISEISGKTIIGVPVYSLEALLARKILALHNRTEGKDIFDLANFIPKANLKLVTKSLEAMLRHEKSKKLAKDVIIGCVEKLDTINIKEVKTLTNNYIPMSLRPDWDELTATLKMKLEGMQDANP